MDPVPARDPGSRKTSATSRVTPAKHVIAPESTLQRTVYLEQHRARRQADGVLGHVRADDPTASTRRSMPRRSGALEPTPELAPYLARAAAAHRVHRRHARVLARSRRRRAESLSHRAEALRRGRSHPMGRRARVLDDHEHQRLRAARRSRGLRPADVAAHDAAAPQRHSRALAVGHGLSDGDYDNLHDWGWLYLAPYGWLPMDVTFGRFDDGAIRRSTASISAASMRTASPSTTTTASRSSPPKRHFALRDRGSAAR